MKKVFCAAFMVIMAVSLLVSQDYDIRKLKWGMSLDELRKAEGLHENLYKTEELLGITVEVMFSCSSKGLHSVAYSCRDKEFAVRARDVLINRYGEPKKELDYSFLVQLGRTLKKYPDAVKEIHEKGTYTLLDAIESGENYANAKKFIRMAFQKRETWRFGSTVVLLLDSIEGVSVSYWAVSDYSTKRSEFEKIMNEINKLTKKTEKKPDEGEKF